MIVIGSSIIALAVVALGLRLWNARRKAARVRAQLQRRASASAQPESSDAEAIDELRRRVGELAAALRRRQRTSKWSDSALYSVPWYLVIGPHSAGKSTALQACGLSLRAPGEAASRSARKAAPRGCEPWFCDHGVLLDLPGRCVVDGEGDAEWSALLAVLRSTRRRRPLDGVVLVYSIHDLLNDPPQQLERKAQQLRSRLEDLGSELGSVLPVYMVLTKADALPGFDEFLGTLPGGVRDQIWGATLSAGMDAVLGFKAEFDLLASVLHSQLLEGLATRRPAGDAGARRLRFPVAFDALRAPLVRLIEPLFSPGRYHEAGLLRGFYFSSGGDRLAAAGLVARAPDTQFAIHTRATHGAARGAFLAELFPRVIFSDRDFATKSRRGLLRDRRKRVLSTITALALSALGALPAVLSCARNFSLIDATLEDTREAERIAGAPHTDGPHEPLELLLARLGELQTQAARFSITPWWGPYPAAPLRDAVRGRYLERLRDTVHGPLRAGLSHAIGAVADRHGLDPSGFEAAFRNLKLYLMLAHPERLDLDFATDALASAWAQLNGRDGARATPSLVLHARHYLEALRAHPDWAWLEDGVLVTRARAQLASMPVEEIRYAALEQAAAGAPPVLPEHIFVGESARYVSTRGKVEVPGLYTALGWQRIQPLLQPEHAPELPRWVLGNEGDGIATGSAEQLRELYFDRYVRAWMDFLVGLDVATPDHLSAAIAEMAALDPGEGPYVRLFRRLAENTRLPLDPATPKQAALAVPGAPPLRGEPAPERRVSRVEQYFRRMVRFAFGDAVPTPGVELPPSLLHQYLEQLRSLEVSLRQLQDSGSDPSTEFAAELERTSTSIERLLAGFDQTERLVLEPLLLNPVRGSRRIVEANGRSALTDRWRAEVWEPYRRIVAHYPFAPNATSELGLADFSEFFRPRAGTLWRFYEDALASRLLRSGERFMPRPSALPIRFKPNFLRCLSAAREIGEALFAEGAQQPTVSFKVRIQPVDARISETRLVVDGATLVHRNEPERWHTMQWPGDDGPAGASLRIQGADFSALIERDEGDFGFLRLLASGDVQPVSPGSLTLEANWRFNLRGAPSGIVIQLQASRRHHPFSPALFSRLNCPPAIASAPARH